VAHPLVGRLLAVSVAQKGRLIGPLQHRRDRAPAVREPPIAAARLLGSLSSPSCIGCGRPPLASRRAPSARSLGCFHMRGSVSAEAGHPTWTFGTRRTLPSLRHDESSSRKAEASCRGTCRLRRLQRRERHKLSCGDLLTAPSAASVAPRRAGPSCVRWGRQARQDRFRSRVAWQTPGVRLFGFSFVRWRRRWPYY